MSGSWGTAANPGTKTIGISAVMLHTGKVLIFGGRYTSTNTNTAAYLFDPVAGTGHEVPAPAPVFCGAITVLSDGRVLSVGGADPIPKGIVDVWLFDPNTERWIRQPNTPRGRYYPTTTKLSDGRVVITAGQELNGSTHNPTVEVYTPPAPGEDVGTVSVVGPEHVTGFYPHQFVMPDGQMLQVDRFRSYRLAPTTWRWTQLPRLRSTTGQGAAHLMLPGAANGSTRVMMIGGLRDKVGLASTQRFNYADPAAGWSFGNAMPTRRAHMNVVQVPDGSAFGIGGNSASLVNSPQHQTMHYDPATDSWTNMAVQAPRRAYHSTAVLLPDGRIMSAGDDRSGGGRQLIDFYSPPYLFRGPRPHITSAPPRVGYLEDFQVTTSGPAVDRAVLMAPGATTHANEMHTRHIELSVTSTSVGFTATAPTANVAPPGYYMLFALTADGVPSVARWVHVGQ